MTGTKNYCYMYKPNALGCCMVVKIMIKYVFGLFVGYLMATVACILDRKLKDDKKE